MQLAIRSSLTAGVAVVAASALLIAPVSVSASPAIQVPAISAAKVELAATVNPIAPWLDVFSTAFTNAVGIGSAVLADPAPALRQLLTNQLVTADVLVTSLTAFSASFTTYLTETVPRFLKAAVADLAQGDITGAAQQINYIVGNLLFSALPLFPLITIPGQMADTFARVVNTVIGLEVILPVVANILGPVNGAIGALGVQGQAFVDALGAGDPIAAISAIINTPAVITGAVLNGFDGPSGPTPGLLSPPDADGFGGLFYSLFVSIPQAIADALVIPPAARQQQQVAPLTTEDPTESGISALPNSDTTVITLDTSTDPADGALKTEFKKVTVIQDVVIEKVVEKVVVAEPAVEKVVAEPVAEPAVEKVVAEPVAEATTPVTAVKDEAPAAEKTEKPADPRPTTKNGNKAVPGQVNTGVTNNGVTTNGSTTTTLTTTPKVDAPETSAPETGTGTTAPTAPTAPAGAADPGAGGASNDSGPSGSSDE